MALKQKCEAAFVAIVAAVLGPDSPIKGYTSQEDQSVTRTLPRFQADHTGGPEKPVNSGVYRDKVLLRIFSTADKQETDDVGAIKAAHAANVTAVREAACKNAATGKKDMRDMASRLSAAVADYQVFGVTDLGSVDVEPDGRSFVDALLFEVIHGETDCV